jgi:hypothetical protein
MQLKEALTTPENTNENDLLRQNQETSGSIAQIQSLTMLNY